MTMAEDGTAPQHSPEGPGPHDRTDVVEAEVAAGVAASTGVRSITAEDFHPLESVGGVRGLIESMAPGLVFVVLYVATSRLTLSLVVSSAVALLAVVVRLAQRTPVTQAFAGILGVAVGGVWAWRSGNPSDYYLPGILTNAGYLLAVAVTALVRWPVVGLVVEALRAGLTDAKRLQEGAAKGWTAWRRDPVRMRAYLLATWMWAAMFAVRLVVQVPLYLDARVGWLGTARLVLGLPLWAVTLWLTWILVRPRAASAAPGGSPRSR